MLYRDIGLRKCPHCGSDTGYYFYKNFRYMQEVGFDGEPILAEECLTGSYDLKTLYCIDCEKKIKPINEVE